MPYVDLPNSPDDYASLWYITNSPTGTVGGFDPAKATIVLLHPLFLDSSWLTAQFEDPRLSSCYNLIAFDARHAGQTTSRLNGKQDSWTDAADLAFALEVRSRFVCVTSETLSFHPDSHDDGRLMPPLRFSGTVCPHCTCLGM
jgi:pimeloyl-ACP methyl ester carboxylesterase